MSASRIIVLILLGISLPVVTAVAGETSQVDDHTVVRNTEPALPMLELELEELWRRGGESD